MEKEEISAEILAAREAGAKYLATIMATLSVAGDDMEFGYADFIRICGYNPADKDDFAGFFRVERAKGVYLKEIPDWLESALTDEEDFILSEHPDDDPTKPLLPFPFTISRLKKIINWCIWKAMELPVYVDALEKAIAEKKEREAIFRSVPAAEQPPQRCAPRDDEEAKPENPQMAGLNKINNAKKELMDRARTHALSIWDADDTRQEFTLKDVAKQVENILGREGVTEFPSHERIKYWIRPVAPEYARKGGRPRKTP